MLFRSALESSGAVESFEHESVIQYIVHTFLNGGRTIEALIIDGIACQDSLKEIKKSHYEIDTEEVVDEETGEVKTIETKEKVYDYDFKFDKRKLVKHLSAINQQFMENYFSVQYGVSLNDCEEILSKLKKLNNAKLYNKIEKTLINLRQDSEILSCLQNNK